jgi:hypothetical protein
LHVACRMLHVSCCVLRVACCPSFVACCMLPPEHAVPARTHARAQRARADALVGMSVADGAVRRTPLVICAFTLHWPRLPLHTLCTAAAPHPSLRSSVGLQLQQITATGTEKALLADVTEAHPDASYIELLRLFKVRRSVADGHSQRAWLHLCPLRVAREHPFAAAAHDPLFGCCGSTLFVCLFVCLID